MSSKKRKHHDKRRPMPTLTPEPPHRLPVPPPITATTAQSMNARYMSMDAILDQLASMKDNAQSFLEADEPDSIWKADIEACEAATAILSVLQDEGIADPEAAKDLLVEALRGLRQADRGEVTMDDYSAAIRHSNSICQKDCYHNPHMDCPYFEAVCRGFVFGPKEGPEAWTEERYREALTARYKEILKEALWKSPAGRLLF